MSKKIPSLAETIYHPGHALIDPDAYYDRAFDNYPHPARVQLVGRLTQLVMRPEVSFPDGMTEQEYFGEVSDETPIITTFTHRGNKRFHDVGAAARTVFGIAPLKRRIPRTRVWAAAPYMTSRQFGRTIQNLGGIPVIRSGDYTRYGKAPSQVDRDRVNESLISHSVEFLEEEGTMLGVFPAGTKGSATLREGVGLVTERLSSGYIVPVALVSKTEATSNFPRHLRIAFGDKIEVQSGQTHGAYLQQIGTSLHTAAERVGGETKN